MVVGETGRGVGMGAGDQWVKPGDWELGDHVTELCFRMGESLLEFEDSFTASLFLGMLQ